MNFLPLKIFQLFLSHAFRPSLLWECVNWLLGNLPKGLTQSSSPSIQQHRRQTRHFSGAPGKRFIRSSDNIISRVCRATIECVKWKVVQSIITCERGTSLSRNRTHATQQASTAQKRQQVVGHINRFTENFIFFSGYSGKSAENQWGGDFLLIHVRELKINWWIDPPVELSPKWKLNENSLEKENSSSRERRDEGNVTPCPKAFN